MGHSIGAAYDPSVGVRRRHLPGFAREEPGRSDCGEMWIR